MQAQCDGARDAILPQRAVRISSLALKKINVMGKILESDFRKELYKNLVEAGYEKEEAQKIVGAKYYDELRQTLIKEIDLFLDSIVKERFDGKLNTEDLSGKMEELKRLKEIVG